MFTFMPSLKLAHISPSYSVIRSYLTMNSGVFDYLLHLACGQFSKPMRWSTRSFLAHCIAMLLGRDISSSTNPVGGVVRIIAPPKMVGVNAGRIVAGVECERTFWPVGPMDCQRNVSGQYGPPLSIDGHSDTPIPSSTCACSPYPAILIASPFNLSPKTGLQFIGDFWQNVISHCAVLSRCGQGLALLTQRLRPALYNKNTAHAQAAGV